MLAQGYSVNLYMFHGGTTRGFMNGANFEKAYQPQTSSYDYDAALDESGRPTKKFLAFREVIAAAIPSAKLPAVPEVATALAIPPIALSESASLWGKLGTPVEFESPMSMESLGQSFGYIVYRAHVEGPASAELLMAGMHDYAKVFVDGAEQGTLDTRLGQTSLVIHANSADNALDILVENGGRINFSKHLRNQRKGIVGPVTLAGKELRGWWMYPLPMGDVSAVKFAPMPAQGGPQFQRGVFALAKTGDTFLDMRESGKGVVWVNGHLLGRFWKIGPQQTLYVPAPWLKVGTNEVVVFELEGAGATTLQGLAAPVYSQ